MNNPVRHILFCLFFLAGSTLTQQDSGAYPLSEKTGEIPPPLVLPYQKCGQGAVARTQKWIESLSLAETEAEFCFECRREAGSSFAAQSAARQIKEAETAISLPKECFLAMAVRGNRTFKKSQYVDCGESNSYFQRKTKLCVNNEYIEALQKLFFKMADCFSYTSARRQQIFHLINQESGGIVNILSESEAKCLGQITGDYVKTLNNQIKSKQKSGPIKHTRDIYSEVIQKCPELSEKKLKKSPRLICESTKDTYACLLYSFLGLERNLRSIRENLDFVPEYMGAREFNETDGAKLSSAFPLTVSEMARVKVRLNGEEKEWLIWGDADLYDTLQEEKEKGNSPVILSAEKIPLFQRREDIELFFNYWAHNGGGSLAGTRMISMMERLKQRLSSSCNPRSNSLDCLSGSSVLQEEGLSNKDAVSFFAEDLFDDYPGSFNRKTEVSQYVNKIINTSQNVFAFKEKSEGTNNMLNHYKNAFKYGDIKLSDENAVNFQKHIDGICPTMRDLVSWEQPEK